MNIADLKEKYTSKFNELFVQFAEADLGSREYFNRIWVSSGIEAISVFSKLGEEEIAKEFRQGIAFYLRKFSEFSDMPDTSDDIILFKYCVMQGIEIESFSRLCRLGPNEIIETLKKDSLLFDDYLGNISRRIEREKDAYKKVFGLEILEFEEVSASYAVSKLIDGHENKFLEFKSSWKYCFNERGARQYVTHSAIKSIAAFMNTDGGKLILGVDDDKNPTDLSLDLNKKQFSKDEYQRIITQGLDSFLDPYNDALVRIEFEEYENSPVCVLTVKPNDNAHVYVKYKNQEQFFRRRGSETVEYTGKNLGMYMQENPKRSAPILSIVKPID